MENFKAGHLGKKNNMLIALSLGQVKEKKKQFKTIKKSFNFLQRIRTTDIRILNFNATRLNNRERYVLAPNV